jgi:Alpha/beta hydrolase domain containing 18
MALLSSIDGALGKLDTWYFRYYQHINRAAPAMFHLGWGSHKALEAINANWHTPQTPASISIDWESDWIETEAGLWRRCGSFPTPAYIAHLPPESACVHVHFVRPVVQGTGPVVVLMPTSSEVGVEGRLPLARALAKQGISSMLLESPFMGRRKPAAQYQTRLSYFSDFSLLCATSIEEARSVLGWLGEQGFTQLCTAGFSKGGYLATVAGLRSPLPTHVVALLPPHSGVAVLVDGLLGGLCDWELLQRTSGSSIPVRLQMAELFEHTSLEHLPIPQPPQRLTLIAARQDRYIPRYSYEKLARRWDGHATVHWLAGGHVSSIIEKRHLIRAITTTLLSR